MNFTTKDYINVMEEVKPALYKYYSLFEKASNMMEEMENLEKQKTDGLSFGQKIIFVFLLIFYIVPGVIYYFSAKSKNEKHNNEINEKIKSIEKELDIIAPEINGLELEILTGVHTSSPFLLIQQIVPKDYLFPRPYAFERILSYFTNNRASNPKEAINLYEEELHRERMEYNQQQALYQQRLQTVGTYANVVANSINRNN